MNKKMGVLGFLMGLGSFLEASQPENFSFNETKKIKGESDFERCLGLIEVEVLTDAVGDYAFYGCTNLKNVKISKDAHLLSIGDYAFYRCLGLDHFEIPSTVRTIGFLAFCGCESLKEMTIPSNVERVGIAAFCGCSSLKKLEISPGVESIGNFAFCNCPSLIYLEIPTSVTSIGFSVFSLCPNLSEIKLPKHLMPNGITEFIKRQELESGVEKGAEKKDQYDGLYDQWQQEREEGEYVVLKRVNLIEF